MAELIVARLTIKLACKLFSTYASDLIEGGDVAEEKVRQALLSDFKKIHENLDALRRKELVAAVAFMETGFEVLVKDEETSKEEFNKARDAALMAFGVVAEPIDKILATKILVTSTLNEFNDNLETANSLCCKYLHRMNELPGVTQTCKVIFTPVKSFSDKLHSVSGNTKRDDILQAIAEVNKCVFDYFLNYETKLSKTPLIRFATYNISPVSDLILYRRPVVVTQLDKSLSNFVSVAMSQRYIFAALASSETVKNDVIAINMENNQVTHLIGHEANVTSLCCNKTNLFTSSYDKSVIIWDIETLQPIKTLSGHEGSVGSVCESDSYLFSGSTDANIRVWDLHKEFECVQILEHRQYVSKVTCSRQKFLFCIYGVNNIQIWNVHDFTVLHTFKTGEQAINMIMMSNDSRCFIATKETGGHAIECWNLGSLKLMAKIPEPGRNMVKYFHSPYIICGEENLRLISTSSQRLIMEKCIVADQGRFVGRSIKYLWMEGVVLYVLCEGVNNINCILKY